MYLLKALIITTLIVSSSAATIFLRGSSIECTSARVQIVSALNDASGSVGKIKDTSVANAARAGITQATGGIGQIAKAIFSLQGPSVAGRSATEAGLKATAKALEKGSISDPAVVAAQAFIERAQQAGKDVVAKC